MAEETVTRETLELDGVPLSYLHAGEGSPILLLHGTYWSRVWLPVLPRLARERAAFALDFPGFGHSGSGSKRGRPRCRPWQTSSCGWRTL